MIPWAWLLKVPRRTSAANHSSRSFGIRKEKCRVRLFLSSACAIIYRFRLDDAFFFPDTLPFEKWLSCLSVIEEAISRTLEPTSLFESFPAFTARAIPAARFCFFVFGGILST